MADTIPITPGSGATVGTDEVNIGGTLQHVQRVKLVDGSNGGADPIPGDATWGLDVDVRRVDGGSIAHDAADSGAPIKVGGRARTSAITAVANDDRVDFLTDALAKLIVRPHCIPEVQLSGVNSATTTGNTSVIAAQGAGTRLYITSVAVANSSAGTNSIIEIKSATTVVYRTACPAGGGSNLTFDPPLRCGDNEALQMAALTAATTIYFSANGYVGV